jgi:outer membrane murein-binding lipoprotein Lpp
MRTLTRIGLICLTLTLASAPAWAQQGPDGNGGDFRPPPGNFDPGAFRQHRLDDLKSQLNMNDQDFSAIQPMLQKVMDLQRDLDPHHGPPPRGPGMDMQGPPDQGPPGQGPQDQGPPPGQDQGQRPPPSDLQQKMHDLHETLQNPDASNDDLKSKVDAIRAAKAKARDELAKTQERLTSLVTTRQEAVLVDAGLLD